MGLMLRIPIFGAIILFWAVMWSQLIRSEMRPAKTALRVLPLDLVLRDFFAHEQTSALFLRENGRSIGHLRLMPKKLADAYSLGFVGGLQFTPPGETARHSGLDGTLLMDGRFHPRVLQGAINTRADAASGVLPVRVEFSADAETRRGHYRYVEDKETVLDQDFTLDEEGLAQILRTWGIGPEWKQQAPALTPGSVEVTARQVRLTIRDEPADATKVTLRAGGQTWLETIIAPPGQVQEIKTLWGWTLSAE